MYKKEYVYIYVLKSFVKHIARTWEGVYVYIVMTLFTFVRRLLLKYANEAGAFVVKHKNTVGVARLC